MNQGVERGQIGAADPQEVICLSCHRPGAGDFGPGVNKSDEARGLIWPMCAELDLHKALNLQAQAQRVQEGGTALNIALCFQSLATPAGLTCREVQEVTQLLRRQMGIFLKRDHKVGIGRIDHVRQSLLFPGYLVEVSRIQGEICGIKRQSLRLSFMAIRCAMMRQIHSVGTSQMHDARYRLGPG